MTRIKYNVDATDASGASEVDPLSGAASGFDAPKYPVLAADRICRFEITQARIESVKDDVNKPEGERRNMLVMTLKTTKEYPDKDGKPLRAGFSCFKRVGLFEIRDDPKKRDRTFKDNIGPELAEVLRCAGLGNRSPRELITNPSIIQGSVVDMKTSISPEKDGFPESNNLKFVPPA